MRPWTVEAEHLDHLAAVARQPGDKLKLMEVCHWQPMLRDGHHGDFGDPQHACSGCFDRGDRDEMQAFLAAPKGQRCTEAALQETHLIAVKKQADVRHVPDNDLLTLRNTAERLYLANQQHPLLPPIPQEPRDPSGPACFYGSFVCDFERFGNQHSLRQHLALDGDPPRRLHQIAMNMPPAALADPIARPFHQTAGMPKEVQQRQQGKPQPGLPPADLPVCNGSRRRRDGASGKPHVHIDGGGVAGCL